MYIHLLSGKRFACRAQVIAPRERCALSSARAGVIPQCTQCWQPGRDFANGWSLLIAGSGLKISKNRGGQLKKVWWWRLPDSVAVRLGACLLPAACPGHLTTVLRRAVMSYFGVTPIRKVAESQPCCARCCTCRGVTVPCPKETES